MGKEPPRRGSGAAEGAPFRRQDRLRVRHPPEGQGRVRGGFGSRRRLVALAMVPGEAR